MAPDPEPQWPPRSPHEALLSTPGGRQRYRERLNQTSPTPSPSRRTRPATHQSPTTSSFGVSMDLDGDDDDDEETLQLKLQEIQARLKLKKLQSARAKKSASVQGQNDQPNRKPDSEPGTTVVDRRRFQRSSTPTNDETGSKSRARDDVQVPASPVQKLRGPQQQTSPSRVLLGIDKGLRGKDVSLRRVPSAKRIHNSSATGSKGPSQHHSITATSAASLESSRPQSFNERLATARTEEAFRAERQNKIQKLRSNAFDIGQGEMDDYKNKAINIPDEPLPAPSFSRDEVLGKAKSSLPSITQSRTLPSFRTKANDDEPGSTITMNDDPKDSGETDAGEGDIASFETYSSLHLSKRYLPHVVLARHVSGKKILCIKDLLKQVKAPDFSLPDVEQDIVVFAILSKKSEPRDHKPSLAKNDKNDEDRGKYMVMNLVDLDFELDLFLFNSGFTRFWKLMEGTVLAILNPTIMPPPAGRQDTGRFSLVINSDEDTILEVGASRDLGFCKSVKKDGKACGSWINKKRTEFCEYHSNEALRKQRSNRVEMNSSGFGGRERHGRGGGGGGGGGGGPGGSESSQKKGWNKNYDWETRSQWFMAKTHSAADLIDGKDRAPSDRKDKAEFVKRSTEAKEKEREIMKKLGQVGNSAGREYMQRAGSRPVANVNGAKEQRPSVLSLSSSSLSVSAADGGELASKPSLDWITNRNGAGAVQLSPVKRKRPESSQTGSIASSSSNSGPRHAYGWGSSLKDKLANMKEGEKLRTEGRRPQLQQHQQPQQPQQRSPVRKKTRFVTDKGIREAGRESLGMVTLGGDDHDHDGDEDELVIIK